MSAPQESDGSGPPRQGGPPGIAATPDGLIHSYQAYDPKNFPSPTAPPPDLAGLAMEHMLAYGSLREFTPEELARAIHLDPSMIPRLGPSLDALAAMLQDRKAKILARYETETVVRDAADTFDRAARQTHADQRNRDRFAKIVRERQIADLERLWYDQRDEQSPFARDLLRLITHLGNNYQIDQLAAKYHFTGRESLTIPKAIDIKHELEAIDDLLEQLKQAAKTAQLAIIDMEQLAEFAEAAQIEELNRLAQQVQDYLRQEAERQGLEQTAKGYHLTPQAYKLFQGKLLSEIFSDLQAARSGRHQGPIAGDGAVEMQCTKPYQFGDSVTHMDVPQTFINALLREGPPPPAPPAPPAPDPTNQAAPATQPRIRIRPDDIETHQTRNNPKCATTVLLDMSGSMRYNGQYINVKRMGLAMDALIRREYPGDFLRFVELYTFATPRPSSEIATLMPKPVSVHNPVVRLRADMSDPDVLPSRIPQHFTNIQRGLQIARRFMAAQDTPNRQVILITDGLPTAHFEGEMLYMLYPPDPRTEEATMREAMLCSREGITINIFLLPSWSQTSEDIQFAQRMAQATRGRVFFTAGKDLDRCVLWDYVSMRRKMLG